MTTPAQVAQLLLDLLAGFNEGRDPAYLLYTNHDTAVLRTTVDETPCEIQIFCGTSRKHQTRSRRSGENRRPPLKLYKE
jgi:hypothetical protein